MKLFLVLVSIFFLQISDAKVQEFDRSFWSTYYKNLTIDSYESAYDLLEKKIESMEFRDDDDGKIFFSLANAIQILIISSTTSSDLKYLEVGFKIATKLKEKLIKGSFYYEYFYPIYNFALIILSSEDHKNDFKAWNDVWGGSSEKLTNPEMRVWYLLYEYYFSVIDLDQKKANELIHKALAIVASTKYIPSRLAIRVLSDAQNFYLNNGRLLEAKKIQDKFILIKDKVFQLDPRNPIDTHFYLQQFEYCSNAYCSEVYLKNLTKLIQDELLYLKKNNKNPSYFGIYNQSIVFANSVHGFHKTVNNQIKFFKDNTEKNSINKKFEDTFEIALIYSKFRNLNYIINEKDIKKIKSIEKKNKPTLTNNQKIIIATLKFYHNSISNTVSKNNIINFLNLINGLIDNINKENLFTHTNYIQSSVYYNHSLQLVLQILDDNEKLYEDSIIISIAKLIEKNNLSKTKMQTNYLNMSDNKNYYYQIKKNYINEMGNKELLYNDILKIIIQKIIDDDFKFPQNENRSIFKYKDNINLLNRHQSILNRNFYTKDDLFDSFSRFPEYTELQKELGKNQLLYTYFTEQNHIISCMITVENSKCSLRNINNIEGKLLPLIQKLRSNMDFNINIDFDKTISFEVFDIIFDNELINIEDFSDIVLLPPSNHMNIPFNALITDLQNEDFLGLTHNLIIVPSLNLLLSSEKKYNLENDYLAFGDPKFSQDNIEITENSFIKIRNSKYKNSIKQLETLPETRKEINNISGLFNKKKIYFHEEATELNFRESIGQNYSVIHIATHGLLSGDFNGIIEEPALVLTPVNNLYYNDGILKASEIRKFNINSDLIILSACNSAIDKDNFQFNKGISDLSLSFFNSGANKLLVSQWAVSSHETSELISNFTEKTIKNESIKNALKNSMREMYEKKMHPKFWAPFILIGKSLKKDTKFKNPLKHISSDKYKVNGISYNFLKNNIVQNGKIYSAISRNRSDISYAHTEIIEDLHEDKNLIKYKNYKYGNPHLTTFKDKQYLVQSEKAKKLIFYDLTNNQKLEDLFNYTNTNFSIFPLNDENTNHLIHYNLTTGLTDKNYNFDNVAKNNKVYVVKISNPNKRIKVNYEKDAINLSLKFPQFKSDKDNTPFYFTNSGLSSDGNIVWINLKINSSDFSEGSKNFSLLYRLHDNDFNLIGEFDSFQIQSVLRSEKEDIILGVKKFDNYSEFQIIQNKELIFSMPVENIKINKIVENNDKIFVLGSSFHRKTNLDEIKLKAPNVDDKEYSKIFFDSEMTYKYSTLTNFPFVLVFDQNLSLIEEIIGHNGNISSFNDLVFFDKKAYLYENIRDQINNIYLISSSNFSTNHN